MVAKSSFCISQNLTLILFISGSAFGLSTYGDDEDESATVISLASVSERLWLDYGDE